MKVCGIDPGNRGAVCVLDTNDLANPALLDLSKSSMYECTKWLHHQNVDIIWLEDVHSLFGMSAKSNFGFGRSVGAIIAISQIATRGVVAQMVTPKVWQKYVGVTAKGKDIKADVAQICNNLYPLANIYGKQGALLDGRSDAICIAHYGLNHHP